MAKNTTNFNLFKPELTDAADITKMNSNWDIVDQQLKLNDTKVTELEQEVDSKIGNLDVYSKGEVDTALGKKANTTDVYSKTEADTLLGKKANTSDVNSALANKANTANVYSKTDVDTLLSPKANKSDVDSALATKANASDLSAKAPLASPTFTGTPKAPTAALGTNTTQVATTAFVKQTVDKSMEGFDEAVFAEVVPVVETQCENHATINQYSAPGSGDANVQPNSFIAVGNTWYKYHRPSWGQTSYFYKSTDKGLTWSSVVLTNPPCSKVIYVESLGKLAYCGGNKFCMSADGVTWTSVDISFDNGISTTVSLHWNEDIKKFVVICYSGVFEGSSDGKTWTNKKTFGGSYKYTNCYTEHDGYYVGVSQSTTDGEGQTYFYLINKSTYAVSSRGYATTSNNVATIKVLNGLVFTLSKGYLKVFSTTGNTYGQLSSKWFDGTWFDVIYDETKMKYYACAYSSNKSYLYTSTDAVNWVESTYDIPVVSLHFYVENGVIYIVGHDGIKKLRNVIIRYDGNLTLGKDGEVFHTFGGSAKVVYGSITGDKTNTRKITFDGKPLFFISAMQGSSSPHIAHIGQTWCNKIGQTSSSTQLSVAWDDNSITLGDFNHDGTWVYNNSNTRYDYFAILE